MIGDEKQVRTVAGKQIAQHRYFEGD